MHMEVILSWYPVKDLERAKKFYGETLGLSKAFEMQEVGGVSPKPGGASIATHVCLDHLRKRNAGASRRS